jgi:hypothetical protein
MTADRVAMIDWDEPHVDVPDLDLVLPHNAADLSDDAYDMAAQPSAAGEAAVCWDDEHANGAARRSLSDLSTYSESSRAILNAGVAVRRLPHLPAVLLHV